MVKIFFCRTVAFHSNFIHLHFCLASVSNFSHSSDGYSYNYSYLRRPARQTTGTTGVQHPAALTARADRWATGRSLLLSLSVPLTEAHQKFCLGFEWALRVVRAEHRDSTASGVNTSHRACRAHLAFVPEQGSASK